MSMKRITAIVLGVGGLGLVIAGIASETQALTTVGVLAGIGGALTNRLAA